MTAYAWKPGTRIHGVDAQAAGEHLELVREKNGGTLTPEAVLADARSNNSPIHSAFEWDDSAAAEKHRLWQARYLMACLTVNVTIQKQEERPVRAFVNVTKAEERQYVPVAAAMADPDLRKQVLDRAWNDLLAWRQKYSDLKELASIFEAVDRAKADKDAA